MAANLFSGGLMLGAMFMATDYVTSPVTHLGQVVFGIGCGVITVVIRYFGGYPEGVSYAILIMNCCVVLLDRIGRPKKFGAPKKVKKGVAKV
jgi:electron transport complex protein RnfD